MNYNEYITSYIDKYPLGEPIYIEEIKENVLKLNEDTQENQYKLSRNINVIVNRLIKRGNIKKFYKGIYYKPKKNIFGEVYLDSDVLIEQKYLKDKHENIKGYIYGAKLYNLLGLTTQVPNGLQIVTNECKNNNKYTNTNLNVTIKKPKIKITNDNYRYLQLLDILENKDNVNIEVENKGKVILNYIQEQKLDYLKILGYIKATNNNEAMKNLMDLIEV